MSERIRGITIEFNGDAKGLKKALVDVNRFVKQTNTALNEVNRALKLNPNSVTLLSQKQQLLKRRTEEVTDRITIMRRRLEQMKNDPSVDKKSAEFQKLQRELIKAEAYQKRFAREMLKFGNARFNAVGGSLQTVGNKLTNVTRRARQAAAALAGIALYKGFQRLKTLDDVSTELQKLGYRGKKLDQIMDDATESVSGTKYALTDMSKVAKGALGAGVEKSYNLGDYLSRVADLAAVGGTSVDKMGALMNKALSKGVVDAKLLNQMNANGIPIYTLLADSMGVTTDELTKLVRSGKVGFDDLYKATEKYNGMAKELGTETFSGAVTVLGQQFGLMGAEFLQGAYEPIKSGVKGIVAYLKELRSNGTIKEWGTAVGEAIRYFVEWFKKGEASVEGLSGKAQNLITVFTPVVKVVGMLVKAFMALPDNVKMALAAFALIGGPVLTLLGSMTKLVGIFTSFGQVAGAVGGVANAFRLFAGVPPQVLLIVAAIGALIAIGVLLYKNWDKIKAIAKSAWADIKWAIMTPIKAVKSFLSGAWAGIRSTAKSAWEGVKSAIVSPITSAFNKVKGIIKKIKNAFPISLKKLVSFALPNINIGSKSTKVGDKSVKSPTFSVGGWKHYAKAMNNPYMFRQSTGIIAGEAGNEILYGHGSLMRDIEKATSGRAVNNTWNITVNGADDPKLWADKFMHELKLQMRTSNG